MENNICIKLGKRIRLLRKKYNLTQDELAERSALSTKYIQNLEGKSPKKASIVTLEKLARGFGIPISKIVSL